MSLPGYEGNFVYSATQNLTKFYCGKRTKDGKISTETAFMRTNSDRICISVVFLYLDNFYCCCEKTQNYFQQMGRL